MGENNFLKLQKFFHEHESWRLLADFFATRVIYFYVALPVVLVWFGRGRFFIVATGAALVIGFGILAQIIARVFPRMRPYQKFKFKPAAGVGLFSDVDKNFDSFPSGHITSMVALSIVAYLFIPWAGIVSGVVTVLTASARVALGYHYISDILGGIAVGTLSAVTLFWLGLL